MTDVSALEGRRSVASFIRSRHPHAGSPFDSQENDMRELLKSSVGCQDGANLRSTIHELCTGLGEISHFDVLTLSRSGKHQALCFFRLESPAQEKRLMTNLGVTRFGSELLFVVDLPQEAKLAVEGATL
jgi:hypothetical protein